MLKLLKFMLPVLILLVVFSFVGFKVVRKYYTSGPDDADMLTSRPASSALAQAIDRIFGGPPEEAFLDSDSSETQILAVSTFEENFSSKGIYE
jgi:hypothetical protein